MTDRQLALIDKIDRFVNDEEDDSDFEFEEYRELNNLLQKSLKLEDLAKDLYGVADALCDRMTDFPAGCYACSLYSDDYDEENDCTFCDFERIKKEYEELIG
jgi:hypothetical protein